jgi:hypothetical protein
MGGELSVRWIANYFEGVQVTFDLYWNSGRGLNTVAPGFAATDTCEPERPGPMVPPVADQQNFKAVAKNALVGRRLCGLSSGDRRARVKLHAFDAGFPSETLTG